MKKLVAIVLACVMVLGLAACGQKQESTNTSTENNTETKKVYKVGVCQLVQHVALDAATEGFIDAVKAGLGAENVEFITQVASGDLSTCTTVVNNLISKDVDLIMANATAALQAAAQGTKTIPVLGTSITEYGTALEIDNFNGVVGGNVSGASDLAPLDQQAAMIKEWFPSAQKVALLYCSNEPNSKYQVVVIAEELKKLGIESKEFSFSDSNDLSGICQSACEYADVMYVPTDNTAASNTETIANIVVPAGVPVIAGEEGICKGCGVATLSLSYYDIGQATGNMAVKVLKGEADISKMPIEYAPKFTKEYNEELVKQYGLTVPSGDYQAIQ